VGTETPNQTDCPYSAQQNPVDGKNYVVVSGDPTYLATVDTTTGLYTKIDEFNGEVITDGQSPWKLMITKSGDAYLAAGYSLYRLDLTSAATTRIGAIGALDSTTHYDAIAYNPVDDTIYLFGHQSGNAYRVNTTTGVPTATPEHNITLASNYTCPGPGGTHGLNPYDGLFDANGNLWIQNDGCDVEYLVVDFATGSATYIGELNDTQHALYTNSPYYDFYSYASLITTDTAALPDTGASAMALVSTGAIAAGLLAAGALALIMVRRRQAGK
jgi:LPXTG-motif cell wall-anchored protein